LVLSSKEKESLVIDLLNKNYTLREIAKMVHVSFSFIAKIRKKLAGEEYDEEPSSRALSIDSQAFKLFLDKKKLVEVAISLDITTEDTIKIYSNYLTLQNMGKVFRILAEHRNEMGTFLKWFNFIQKNSIKAKDIKKAIDNVNSINALTAQKEKLQIEIDSIIEERDCYLKNLEDIKKDYY
jgi:transcriptional regulator with XRE-family HTH domain